MSVERDRLRSPPSPTAPAPVIREPLRAAKTPPPFHMDRLSVRRVVAWPLKCGASRETEAGSTVTGSTSGTTTTTSAWRMARRNLTGLFDSSPSRAVPKTTSTHRSVTRVTSEKGTCHASTATTSANACRESLRFEFIGPFRREHSLNRRSDQPLDRTAGTTASTDVGRMLHRVGQNRNWVEEVTGLMNAPTPPPSPPPPASLFSPPDSPQRIAACVASSSPALDF